MHPDTDVWPKRFYDYNTFLKRRFGEKIYKISIHAGFTCPNIDGTVGTGGCIYCDNRSFSPAIGYGELSIEKQLGIGMEVGRKHKAKKFLAYFQAYTNTHAPVERLEQIYAQALSHPEIVGICIGTRPDAVDRTKIDYLEKLAQKTFVSLEYGVQSANERTLRWMNRGHTWGSFLDAMAMSRDRGIHLCAHIMLGSPHETREEVLSSAEKMNDVGIDGIKLHNLLVIRNTRLAEAYGKNPFPLFEYGQYVDLLCDFLERLSPETVIERLCATACDEYLIAPKWGKSSAQVTDEVVRKLKERGTCQGSSFSGIKSLIKKSRLVE